MDCKDLKLRNYKIHFLFDIFLMVILLSHNVLGKTLNYKIYEELRVGSVIARLSEDVADVLARLPNPSSVRFRAMQRGNLPLLLVREENGEISIGAKIDREQLCQKNLNCSIEFDVITLPTEHLQLFHVKVEVMDINDNSPQFSRSVIPIEISESAAVGTRVALDSASDLDVGENSLYTYSLSPNEYFDIEVRTRTDGAKYAELIIIRELDRELMSTFQLQLTASDRGVPQKSSFSILKISISDSNDNSPMFEEQSYIIQLLENSPVGTLLIDLNATDPDEGANGKVVYSFSSHVSPTIHETFQIDPEKGHLSLIKQADYEIIKSYEIDVQAQDLGPNSIPGHCKIIIKVVDVNDNKPDININLMTPGREEVAYISEGAPMDTFVALVSVQDKDSGLNGEVVCKLHGHGHFRLQKTYENNYIIFTNTSLDREKRSEYSLTVIAEDKGIPNLSTVKHFTVQITDENDNPPHFQNSRYEIFLSENNTPGEYITSVMATDPDQGENGQVTYTILENYVLGSSITTYVTIDRSNGAIYALRTFDHEDINRIVFTVQARDGGSHQLISNATVVLTIIDENDNAPAIVFPALNNGTAEVFVPKDVEHGFLITTIKITDRDSGINSELSCTITAGNQDGIFTMDSRTCELFTNVSMETVHYPEWDISVLVKDKGSPQRSTKATLKLIVHGSLEEFLMPTSTIGSQSSLDVSMIVIISLGAVCTVLLVIMVIFGTRCNREKKDTRSYNCRVAESNYQNHPKRPSRQIHKGDITLVPTVNGTLPIRSHHRSSPLSTPTLERGQMSSRQSHHSRQSLNSLVTISSNHVPENFSLELTHSTPPVEVSQLLSMLHQGQYQPRPSFRGNKYARSYRYALQDMDKFSLKDSGRGDSEAGDSDYDLGRDSPIDRILGEGFSDLFLLDGHRLPAAMKLCTDECRVLGHSDQCWMPPLPSPSSSDYRSNVYIPGEELHQHQQPPEEDCQSVDSSERKKSFSTFGKETLNEETDDTCTSSFLTEMNSVFQRLLPPALDTYTECNEVEQLNSLERRKGQLPAKTLAYPQGVAAWAANTYFQNPGSTMGQSNGAHLSTQPTSKWLPAMEEIPENYEEDDFDNVLNQFNVNRRDSKHELMDASELVAEINKLLQDVRQS
ncbi:protocadherin-18-like isoform X2 [Latimeria chalumnae]|uniref:protocadherin-18-like isoform X2 n=1 Tax=Latimeria chalumnae TaxID=7897 RepID=UPI0003C10D83|nr:PREDICTED: protocadherin-18-like isoform X2 [Latimeria chalumnae]|eukprot:XP_006013383.1 PREDICTED: protocadherin-18-like isoform X2 [Latimeria chalumnae]